MNDGLLQELIAARGERKVCALVTVASTKGSVPRGAGSKMLVYGDGKTSGTIGGGKFESLVRDEALAAMREKMPVLKAYPLREGEADSFGAICGGEATVLIEPQLTAEAIYLIGGGHCARAIAELASEAGFDVSVIEDRHDMIEELPGSVSRIEGTPAEVIRSREWQSDEAIVLVSRNHNLDRDALAAAVQQRGIGYIGMIGSKRKVRMVFDELIAAGVPNEAVARVYAPVGLDIGADSPAEIAISVLAEIIAVLRGHSGAHMRLGLMQQQ